MTSIVAALILVVQLMAAGSVWKRCKSCGRSFGTKNKVQEVREPGPLLDAHLRRPRGYG